MAHDSGFRIYLISNPEDFKLIQEITIPGGVKLIRYLSNAETLDKKVAAIVGSGTNADFPSNKVVFWDCDKNLGIAERNFSREVRLLSFTETA